MKTIIVNVEKSSNGEYWASTQNFIGVVATYGKTLQELDTNIRQAIADNLEVAEELGDDHVKEYKRFTLDYQIDLVSFFELIPEIKISQLAIKAGINPSLLRQYKTGAARASREQTQKIEKAVHQLGNELLAVSF